MEARTSKPERRRFATIPSELRLLTCLQERAWKKRSRLDDKRRKLIDQTCDEILVELCEDILSASCLDVRQRHAIDNSFLSPAKLIDW